MGQEFNPVKLAQEKVSRVLGAGQWAIDATVGNGRDTLFLAQCVGPGGKVWGFDIQEAALAKARLLLQEHGVDKRVELIQANHAAMDNHLPRELKGRIRAVMFNLGYLPGGDKSIITKPAETIKALNSALSLVAPGGILSVVSYIGHAGGGEEYEAIKKWCASADSNKLGWKCETNSRDHQFKPAPVLFIIEKSLKKASD